MLQALEHVVESGRDRADFVGPFDAGARGEVTGSGASHCGVDERDGPVNQPAREPIDHEHEHEDHGGREPQRDAPSLRPKLRDGTERHRDDRRGDEASVARRRDGDDLDAGRAVGDHGLTRRDRLARRAQRLRALARRGAGEHFGIRALDADDRHSPDRGRRNREVMQRRRDRAHVERVAPQLEIVGDGERGEARRVEQIAFDRALEDADLDDRFEADDQRHRERSEERHPGAERERGAQFRHAGAQLRRRGRRHRLGGSHRSCCRH